MHPFHQAMRIRQEKINKEKKEAMTNRYQAYQTTPKNFGQIQDITSSDFFRDTQQHLRDMRKRELIQKRIHDTANKLNSHQLDNFIKATD